MTEWFWGRLRPLQMRGLVLACASWLPACGLALGLDPGRGLVDAAPDASAGPLADADLLADGEESSSDSTLSDGPSSDLGTTGDDVPAPQIDGGGQASSGPVQADGCTPDPNWCDSHCGKGPDNCGETRQCASDCPQSYTCGARNTCDCQAETGWCTGRCGRTTDNCGSSIDCGTCDGGQCQAESTAQACRSRQCGQVTNNCGQLVNCGLLGTELCLDVFQRCLDDGGCCTPRSASACGNKCASSATDECGKSVQCPSSCGSGRVCVDQTCCTRTDPCAGRCGVTLTDNCGQPVKCECSGSDECVSMMCIAGGASDSGDEGAGEPDAPPITSLDATSE